MCVELLIASVLVMSPAWLGTDYQCGDMVKSAGCLTLSGDDCNCEGSACPAHQVERVTVADTIDNDGEPCWTLNTGWHVCFRSWDCPDAGNPCQPFLDCDAPSGDPSQQTANGYQLLGACGSLPCVES